MRSKTTNDSDPIFISKKGGATKGLQDQSYRPAIDWTLMPSFNGCSWNGNGKITNEIQFKGERLFISKHFIHIEWGELFFSGEIDTKHKLKDRQAGSKLYSTRYRVNPPPNSSGEKLLLISRIRLIYLPITLPTKQQLPILIHQLSTLSSYLIPTSKYKDF